MPNPIVKIHNVETGEVVEREMNEQELAQWKLDQAQATAKAQAKAEAQAQKQAILDRLGLTEEELRIVLG